MPRASASASSTGRAAPSIHGSAGEPGDGAERRGQVDQPDRAWSPPPAPRRPTGAGRQISGSRIRPSTWYGPLNSRPKSPCSSPWSVVNTTSRSSAQPRAAIAGEHPAERLVDQLDLDGVAGVDLAHLVGGERGRHPAGRGLVVRHERRRRTRAASAGAWRRGCARARRGDSRVAGRQRHVAPVDPAQLGRPAGPTGGAGRGSSSSRTSRRRRRARRARRSCDRPPSRCGTTRAAWGCPAPAGRRCRRRRRR